MPYLLTAFDDVALPRAMPVDDLSTGKVASGFVPSIGRAYNYWGSARLDPISQEITQRGLYVGTTSGRNVRITPEGDRRVTTVGDVRVTSATHYANLRDQVDLLKSKVGVWGQLWRRRIPDGVMTFKYARLLAANHVEEVHHAGRVSEIESLFETLDVGWRSQALDVDQVTISSGSTMVLNVSNQGYLEVTDGILRVAATSGTISSITITGPGIEMAWAGSLPSGSTLVIDSGTHSAPIGAIDAYGGLSFGPGHTSAEWLPIPVGLTIYQVGVVGGTAQVTMEHYDRWP